jgi:hypothetical protein
MVDLSLSSPVSPVLFAQNGYKVVVVPMIRSRNVSASYPTMQQSQYQTHEPGDIG